MTDHCGYVDVPEASMNMRTMIELSARAAIQKHWNHTLCNGEPWIADAILSTLMNPTPEMLAQFERGVTIPMSEKPTGQQIALTVWQAMLRAAKGEG